MRNRKLITETPFINDRLASFSMQNTATRNLTMQAI